MDRSGRKGGRHERQKRHPGTTSENPSESPLDDSQGHGPMKLIDQLRAAVAAGRASGVSEKDVDTIFEDVVAMPSGPGFAGHNMPADEAGAAAKAAEKPATSGRRKA